MLLIPSSRLIVSLFDAVGTFVSTRLPAGKVSKDREKEIGEIYYSDVGVWLVMKRIKSNSRKTPFPVVYHNKLNQSLFIESDLLKKTVSMPTVTSDVQS